MSKVIHICGQCRKRKARKYWYDEITGFTSYFCGMCYEKWNLEWFLFLEKYGKKID